MGDTEKDDRGKKTDKKNALGTKEGWKPGGGLFDDDSELRPA